MYIFCYSWLLKYKKEIKYIELFNLNIKYRMAGLFASNVSLFSLS